MADKIDSVTSRDKLKPRREPYWHRVAKGSYLGFRKMASDSAGTWCARYRMDTGKQVINSLGTLDTHPGHERFDRASELARAWFTHMGMGGTSSKATVLDACNTYVQHVRHERGDGPADDLQARYRRWVEADPIAKIEIAKLSREHVKAFRRRLVQAPVKVGKDGATRERSKDTVNRDLATVRAALNHALADGYVTTDFAWREALKAFKNVSKRRELYLDRTQRRELLKQSPADLSAFLKGLALLPLRPGALAALTVADFDKRLSTLKVGKDKAGADRKVKLPTATAEFLATQAKDKLPAAPLLSRADGKPWTKDYWKDRVKAAALAAKLPEETTAYALRHSVITDLVTGGLDLLTVAQISGTSVAMIEKHYGSLRGDIAATALAKLAL